MADNSNRKLKRHFWLWPILIGYGLIIAGEILSAIIALPFKFIPGITPMWLFTIDYGIFIGIVIVVLVFCFFVEKPIFKSFFPARRGGLAGNTIKEFLIGLLWGFLMNGSCILIAWLHGDLHFSVGKFMPVYLIVTFICVVIQSSAEEMVTRGYIYQAHADRYPIWFAVLANSLVFGALHLSNPGVTWLSIVEIVMSGISLSLVVYVRKSLWMAFGCHAMWNFTQSILFGLPNSGIVSEGSFLHLEAASDSIFYDTGFGVEGTFISVLSECALIAWCLWILHRRKKKEAAA
ncbi:MAG: CPBP family intramembrane metalloprotease [Clostridiales bacterium]|nr:CPBP family intramembrane metalloprotease [Clostridiales bacterium]